MALFYSLASFALFLLIILPTDADYVTWGTCKRYGRRERVREYPTDPEASGLDLVACRIKTFSPNDFDGLPNLVFLWLQVNDIANVDTAAFRSLPNLTKIDLEYNKLKKIVFVQNSCPKLTVLFLGNNQIKTIDNAGTFSACSKLERLFLSNNQIESLHPDLFKYLPNLKELFLDHNKISFIPDQMILNSKLERLDLQDNKLNYMPTNFVGKVPNLSILELADNSWECSCYFELLDEMKTGNDALYWYCDGSVPECVRNDNMQVCRRQYMNMTVE